MKRIPQSKVARWPQSIKKIALVYVCCLVLVGIMSFGVAYAYFSTTVDATGTIRMGRLEVQYLDADGTTSSTLSTLITRDLAGGEYVFDPVEDQDNTIVPGDKITIKGSVENTGSIDGYVILHAELFLMNEANTAEESLQAEKFFNLDGTEVTLDNTNSYYNTAATHLIKDEVKELSTTSVNEINFVVNNEITSRLSDRTFVLKLTIHAIQSKSLEQDDTYPSVEIQATNMLIDNIHTYLTIQVGATEAIVTGYNGTKGTVVIPATYNGKPVTSIADGAFEENATAITSLTIPGSVKTVGNLTNTYLDMESGDLVGTGFASLTSLTLQEGVETIGDFVFMFSQIAEVNIPSSVETIGTFAFAFAQNLNSVTFSQNSQLTTIGMGAFGMTGITSITIPESVTTIDMAAFSECVNLSTVTFEGNSQLTSIGDNAFSPCESLTTITIPSSVTSIGTYAFYECTNLGTVRFEEGSQLISIGEYAFYQCGSLTTITIPSSVTSIGGNAFNNCRNLGTVNFEGNSQLTSIGEGAFNWCENLTSITIPSSVTSIGDYAFHYCESLTTITIPERVTSIGNNAFSDCTNLGTVRFEEGSQLTSIGNSAFSWCKNLTSITIPSGVTSIGNNTFYNCTNLGTVTFEEGSQLTSIGEYAFSLCKNLTSITIPSSVTSIGTYAFQGTGLSTANFGNKSGWTAGSTPIAVADLENTTLAATYLKSTYNHVVWTKS